MNQILSAGWGWALVIVALAITGACVAGPGPYRAALTTVAVLALVVSAAGARVAARQLNEPKWTITSELWLDDKVAFNFSVEGRDGGYGTGTATFEGPAFEKRAEEFKKNLGYE